jgi:hypothetical protein
MARNFYFGSDASMVGGSARFSAMISSDPSSFGLTLAQCEGYAAINATLQSAFQEATTPHTRTPVAVSRKNEAMKAMQRAAVDLAGIIGATREVSDAQLLSLGLLPRAKRTRRNVPDEPPTVRVISVTGRLVRIRVVDRDSLTGRSKPFGARGAQIFSYVGEQPPADSRAYYFEGHASRTTKELLFPNDVPNGATIWLSARWVNARGETSIGSTPISFTLQGGPISASTLSLAA